MTNNFKTLNEAQNEFSTSHPLESELLGNHPYILESLLENEDISENLNASEKRILFFSADDKDEKLEILTNKIIDSFKFEKEHFLSYNGQGQSSIERVISHHKPELVIFFGNLTKFLTYKAGSLVEEASLGELQFSYACLWSSRELNDDPGLKKTAWSLIQQVSKKFS